MNFRCICYVFLIMFSGCYPKKVKQGVVIVNSYIIGPGNVLSDSSLKISYKILFKENKSVQEVPHISFTSDSAGEKTSVKIKHYSYLDLNANVCYNYWTFSDTATAFKQYSDIDSVEVDGGRNFLSNKKFEYESSMNLADTVVSGKTYGRVRLDKKINNNDVYFILYVDCARKNSLIKLFKLLSDSLGCPIVRDETYVKGKMFMIRELKFVSDELSSEELRVFEAWEKNAKKTLVNK